MGKVIAGGSVSLDGFISSADDSAAAHLFGWLNGGDLEYPSVHPEIRFRFAEPDYAWFRDLQESTGVQVIGRRAFEDFDGWGGRHPFDRPVVVVTHAVPDAWVAAHPDAAFTFVTDGLPPAIERGRAIAGDKDIGLTAGKLSSQALALGLVDELWIDVVPVLLGSGTRCFEEFAGAPIVLDGPDRVVEGNRVTHLRYQVRKPAA